MAGKQQVCLVLLGCFILDGFLGLEPGKDKQDYETIEEVKSHEESTENENELEDTSWIPEAVLDVAYYLRKYKNNGYDPRYLTQGSLPQRRMFEKFPSPPLRNLHWEVKKNCEVSFADCLRYLQEKVTQMELPRHLDSLTVIKYNGWTLEKDRDLIKATDDACLELRDRDEKTFNVFKGPLQKFQWLASSSYYMCWYTMKEIHHLQTFTDVCDNFANCLDWNTGPSNGDIRANNERPFACARYSFCPDPCCPIKLLKNQEECSTVNPCSRHKPTDSTCSLESRNNTDFDSLVLNHWNVSCNCDESGLRWESRSGMCVDIDECIENNKPCHEPAQSCLNLPGSYTCVCSIMGYVEDGAGDCIVDPIIHSVIYPAKMAEKHSNKSFADSFFDVVYRLKTVLAIADEDGDKTRSNCLQEGNASV